MRGGFKKTKRRGRGRGGFDNEEIDEVEEEAFQEVVVGVAVVVFEAW